MSAYDERLEAEQCQELFLEHNEGRVKGKQVYQPDARYSHKDISIDFEMKTFIQGKACSTSSRFNMIRAKSCKSVPWILSEKHTDRDELTGRHFYWRKEKQYEWIDKQIEKIKKGTNSYIGSADTDRALEILKEANWPEEKLRKLEHTLNMKGNLLTDPRISNKEITNNCVLIDMNNPKEHIYQLIKEDKWEK